MLKLAPVTAEKLNATTGIRHAFFTRTGGVSEGIYAGLNAGMGSDDDGDHVRENRHRMAAHMGVADDALVSPYQVHSNLALVTHTNWTGERPKVDGIVTATPGLALGIVTADCGPVLFADAQAGVIGAAHAGWKGALMGVLEDTITKMENEGATRTNIVAVLGPCISQTNYEVGPKFPKPFLEENAANSRFFKPSTKPDHHMFDLVGYTVAKLENAGVQASTVNRCTYAEEDNFFSYRRTTHRSEPDYGRQLSAIVLSDPI